MLQSEISVASHQKVGCHNTINDQNGSISIIFEHCLSFRSGNSQLSSCIIIYHLEVGFHNYHHLSSFIIIYHLEVGFHNYHHLSSFVIQKWDSTSIIIYHHLSFRSAISQLSSFIIIYHHLSSFII